ncbi:MAG: hypothetical protein NT099_03845 [Candidatus Saganbacteria bacterium]|nr:hypothetical protein [Candidatus Saganbacteria bacterium]
MLEWWNQKDLKTKLLFIVPIALFLLVLIVWTAFFFLGQKKPIAEPTVEAQVPIPVIQVVPHVKKTSADRGIYITETVAQLPVRFKDVREQAKKAGFNTIVLDAKRSLSLPLLALLKERKLDSNTQVTADPWLAKVIGGLHDEGFIVSVRIVVFKDDHLVLTRPDLAIKFPGGELYRDRKGGKWANPYDPEVRLYNELITERAALSGADEVQFDYVRFPAEGAARDVSYPQASEKFTKVDVICSFLEAVRKRTEKYKLSIAVDIFGVIAWQSKNDVLSLGQDLKRMAKYIDVLSPMFYPSHFHAGYDGFTNPGSEPYYFMNTGVRRAKELLSGEAVSIVPWLQGFNLKSPNYGPNYILEQIRACSDEGVKGYLIWNARNDYSVTFSALR